MRKMLYPKLAATIQDILDENDRIPEARLELHRKLAAYITESKGDVRLNFICTHNSRRSHMAQIWAWAAATYFEIPGVFSYSGGTEATAFNLNAIDAMTDAGFEIHTMDATVKNPRYIVRAGGRLPVLECYSKKFDAPENPTEGFCAVMVCSDVDEACPFVPGADVRIALTFDDPKDSDGTPLQGRIYRERALQIGREIVHAFSLVR